MALPSWYDFLDRLQRDGVIRRLDPRTMQAVEELLDAGLAHAPAELSAALRRVQKDPSFASRLSVQAQQTARSVYALSAVQEQIESVIRQTAGLKPAPDSAEDTNTPIHQVA